jgi:hypothetical protein
MFSQGDQSFCAARRGIDAADQFLARGLDGGGERRKSARIGLALVVRRST